MTFTLCFRMKMENLKKCEQVLINLYAKVEQVIIINVFEFFFDNVILIKKY